MFLYKSEYNSVRGIEFHISKWTLDPFDNVRKIISLSTYECVRKLRNVVEVQWLRHKYLFFTGMFHIVFHSFKKRPVYVCFFIGKPNLKNV